MMSYYINLDANIPIYKREEKIWKKMMIVNYFKNNENCKNFDSIFQLGCPGVTTPGRVNNIMCLY